MPKADLIARLRKATGFGWLSAKLFTAGKSETLIGRILIAKESQKGRLLHDPIEGDPTLAAHFAEAKAKAEQALQDWIVKTQAKTQRPMGGCHLIWKEMKKELCEKHGIEWFTPAEMNPGVRFD